MTVAAMAKTPRQRRREKRLQSIKDAALNLVIEDGLEGFSVNKLAASVDLTPGALYRYFDSRDEILLTIQQEVLEGFERYIAALLELTADRSPLERIVIICRGYVSLERLQPERFRLIGHLVAVPKPLFDEEAVRPAMEVVLRLLGRLAAVIDEAANAGDLEGDGALRRAVIAWSSVQGIVERRKLARLMPDAFQPGALMDELLTALLIGWGAQPAAARDALGTVLPENLDDVLEAATEEPTDNG